MKITLVISLFNESKNFFNLINEIEKLKSFAVINQVLLVNNGSKDNTLELLKKNSLKYNFDYFDVTNSKGYGDGFMAGISRAKNDIVITNHSDCQFSFDILEPYINSEDINNFIIFPKRINRSFLSIIRSMFVKIICSFILLKKIPDVNGQPKMFNAKNIKSLQSWPSGFAFDLFLYCNLIDYNFKFCNPSVKEKNRSAGISSWNISVISQVKFLITYLNDCFKIKKILTKNRYDNI